MVDRTAHDSAAELDHSPRSRLMRSAARPLAVDTVGRYLVARGLVADANVVARVLTGGVSGIAIRVEARGRTWVVKQSLATLKTEAEWHARPERSITEAAAMRLFHELTPNHAPLLIDLDADDFIVTMTAAPMEWVAWKDRLLSDSANDDDVVTARALGGILGTWHGQTFGDSDLASRFADSLAFEQLRVEPFHRFVLARHPQLSPAIEACIADLEAPGECLVHGDYSPKNVLVGPEGLWVLDFEVAKYGAGVFDVAFMLSHLILKAIHRPAMVDTFQRAADAFVAQYQRHVADRIDLARLGWHVGALLLARIDGRSPVGYLDATRANTTRVVATRMLMGDPPSVDETWRIVREGCA